LASGTHPVAPPANRPRLLGATELSERLAIETERAFRYDRPLAVVVIELGEIAADRDAVGDAAISALRVVDVLGWCGSTSLVVVLPETARTADIPARRLLDALSDFAPQARGGLSLCPGDGCTAEALVASARNAARASAPGALLWHAATVSPLRIAGRGVVAVDAATRRLFSVVERLASSDIPVLVTGETGVGKEIVAAALHHWSPRRSERMVSMNCAALVDSLFESELFGHERGAFSGAFAAKIGLLESANGGTVFLDEVGELSLSAQAKLLRVLETSAVTRVGALVERPIDVRIVAATNRDLQAEVIAGRFREDLYFRLGAATLTVPPLRDRPLDLHPLARTFLYEACERIHRPPLTLSDAVALHISQRSWPGNVRELRNLMGYVAATTTGDVVGIEHLPADPTRAAESLGEPAMDAPPGSPRAFRNLYEEIRELERTRIMEALAATGGVRVKAAALIGMPLRTLVTKLKEYRSVAALERK